MYPLPLVGLSLSKVDNNSLALPTSLSALKEAFPIGAWTIPVLSTLKSILPAFTSLPLWRHP
jgi:hypothetical protein